MTAKILGVNSNKRSFAEEGFFGYQNGIQDRYNTLFGRNKEWNSSDSLMIFWRILQQNQHLVKIAIWNLSISVWGLY